MNVGSFSEEKYLGTQIAYIQRRKAKIRQVFFTLKCCLEK